MKVSDIVSNQQPKKRRKLDDIQGNDANRGLERRWRTQRDQRIYSVKLLEALRRTRRHSSTAEKVLGGRQIRETADRVLAVSAKSETRWSRAILANRVTSLRRRKRMRPRVTGECRLKKTDELAGKKRRLPAAERKVKVLSRLVPGCRKLSFSSILEEANDYIAALEMQVRAMAALTDIFATAQTN